MRSGGGFIIDDLDDWHIVIKADEEGRVRRELEAEVRHHSCAREGLGLTDTSSLKRTRTRSRAEVDILPVRSVHRRPDVLRIFVRRADGRKAYASFAV